MTFSKRDSALRDKAGSLWLASSIDTQVLSPCSPLHNPAFSSQILESQNGFTKQAQTLESTFQQSSHSPTAIPRILEEENQANQSSLRADNALSPSLRALHRKAWQSTSSKNAKAQKVDSRIFTQATQSVEILKSATNLKTQQDSRICDEKTRRSRSFFSKSLLCERVQGRILGRM